MLAGMCRRILCNGNESVLSVVSTTLATDSTGNSNLSSASHRHHSYDKSLPTQIQSRHQLPMRMGNGRRVFYFGIPGFGCGFVFCGLRLFDDQHRGHGTGARHILVVWVLRGTREANCVGTGCAVCCAHRTLLGLGMSQTKVS